MFGATVRSERIGELNCTVVGPAERDAIECGVLLCHGFGAPGTDLVPLAHELQAIRQESRGRVEFVFPEAPVSLDPIGYAGGRAWWMIDMEHLQWAMSTGNLRDLRDQTPDGLPAARAALDSVVRTLIADHGWSFERMVVGGFSQGAMVTTDWVLRQQEAVRLLCVMSGTLLNETEWLQLSRDAARVPILQSHGRQDPILGFEAAEWLRDFLVGQGFAVDFRPFNGPHTISGEVLQELADRIAGALPNRE